MRPTIADGLPNSPVTEKPEGVGRALNREILPVVRALREVANFRSKEKRSATTAGAGAFTRVWTSDVLPTDATWLVMAWVAGTSAVAGGTPFAGYLLAASFSSQAGVVSQIGATAVLVSQETDAAVDCRFAVDAVNRQVAVEARDNAVTAMSFTAVVEVTGAEL